MASLRNIGFATEPRSNVDRIRISFEYSDDNQQTWNAFSYVLPDDLFDIRIQDRRMVASYLIRFIAIGKGHLDEDGNIP